MNKNTLTVLALFFCALAYSQALYRTYPSEVLDEERQVKILKPRSYSKNPEKTYPLVIVLDGDYLFEPVAGNVDYLSYWDQMPESFVVGVNMKESRYDDAAVDSRNGLPTERGQKFMDFLMELRGTMIDEYRVTPFTVIVGKDITANLSAYYLLRKKVPVNAFIQIAPEYSPLVEENLVRKMGDQQEYTYFYVGTPETTDVDGAFFDTITDSLFVGRDNLKMKHEQIPNSNKYSVAVDAISRGLRYSFQEYGMIDEQALYKAGVEEDVQIAAEEEMLEEEMTEEETNEEDDDKKEKKKKKKKRDKSKVSVVKVLQEKYQFIEEVYGIKMKLRLVDIATIASFLKNREDWDEMINLGSLTSKEYPELAYGPYLEALGYEGIGRVPRAIDLLNEAYTLEPAAGISQTDVLDKLELLKAQEKD